jgi:nitrile hydratase
LTLAMGATGQWNLDQSRAARESLPPAQYLAGSYYRIWIAALGRLMVERGLVTPAEMTDGRKRQAPSAIARVLAAESVASMLAGGSASARPETSPARFAIGDAVRARVMNPVSHTRLPRYCRGKSGVVAKVHGTHVFPDASARGEGEQPRWLYSVRFDASELWGPDTTAAAVHVDCWEPYLEAR